MCSLSIEANQIEIKSGNSSSHQFIADQIDCFIFIKKNSSEFHSFRQFTGQTDQVSGWLQSHVVTMCEQYGVWCLIHAGITFHSLQSSQLTELAQRKHKMWHKNVKSREIHKNTMCAKHAPRLDISPVYDRWLAHYYVWSIMPFAQETIDRKSMKCAENEKSNAHTPASVVTNWLQFSTVHVNYSREH